ncbi:MAG: CpsD/CapB family tyrosine-protein kinase [Halieaceae bacterium]|jgi:Mrp family chromosome partitioning ATPase|nr:CpsD/CapB family tyrosine-protein kinase [Halieaceae bacterium]
MIDTLQQALNRAREEQAGGAAYGRSAEAVRAQQPALAGSSAIAAVAPVSAGAGPGSRFAADAPFLRQATPLVPLDREHLHRHCIATGAADDPLRAPFDLLRTRLVQRMRTEGWKTLAVLSPDEGEGKTMTAINLAMSIARLPSHTAMLLDLDFRCPGLLSTLGHRPAFGIDDWLAGACVFEQTLFSPDSARLVASGVRAPVAGHAEMLASRRVVSQIDEVASRYEDRVIIVDMPSMLRSDAALMLIPHIDCFLMVVAAGQTLGHRVKECLAMIPRGRFLGTILNKSLH